ncbi:polysaccharide deacetylase family protein [Marinilongibacter aquaticus]|uniref:polysaccharide deacetylase family protein n=1 Tax=Marinilongibacter aquaticus TaxID=2975157 RepID=UPI0021BDA278|nr:polysaccharide deacetylase family protein [Marinilongibacter aquaticus]UBM59295.1 polysaccharide deacetylase family protein [Marinilongibacter aquaticus]
MIWIKVKYRLRLAYSSLLFWSRGYKRTLKNKYGERIVLFHGIDVDGQTKYNSRFVSEAYFEQFIQFCVNNFNVLSLEDYYQGKFKANTLNLVITFDDGYLNNFEKAVPILKKYNVPASFFVTRGLRQPEVLWPDFVDLCSYYSDRTAIKAGNMLFDKQGKAFKHGNIELKSWLTGKSFQEIQDIFQFFSNEWQAIKSKKIGEYWQLMEGEHIADLAKEELFTIGVHGSQHISLANVSLAEAEKDILDNKMALEKILAQPVTSIAFPFGHYNADVLAMCRAIGFEKILTVDYVQKADRQINDLKNRFVINPYISFEKQLYFLLRGKYE